MRPSTKQSRKGNALLEFTLVSIPLIFLLISVVELSRGMWTYSTLAHSIKRGVRYVAVHGASCASASSSCPVTIGDVAREISTGATGLDAAQMSVVLKSSSATQNCSPLSTCLSNAGAWPPSTENDVGYSISISATYPFRSALSMFWPGVGGQHFQPISLGAKSQEEISF